MGLYLKSSTDRFMVFADVLHTDFVFSIIKILICSIRDLRDDLVWGILQGGMKTTVYTVTSVFIFGNIDTIGAYNSRNFFEKN